MNPGILNPYYSIESYYGSRDQGIVLRFAILTFTEFFTANAFLNDKPTTFNWHTFFDSDNMYNWDHNYNSKKFLFC